MRLTELSPKWLGYYGLAGASEAEGKRCHIGLTFFCPCCRQTRIAVLFENPIDDGIEWLVAHWPTVIDMHDTSLHWHREGESFDNLTLSPSIDVSAHGHWHGFITNGEIQ